jgi:hypothetical protein
MKEQPAVIARPLPAQIPTAFLRARTVRRQCGPARGGKVPTCARSYRVTRL